MFIGRNLNRPQLRRGFEFLPSRGMSATVSPDFLLDTRGVGRDLGAFVVGAAWDRGGTACAFALGDGTLRIAADGGADWKAIEAHDGAVLALAADARPGGFVSGGDDGSFRRVRSTARRARSRISVPNGSSRWRASPMPRPVCSPAASASSCISSTPPGRS